jgi:hypothetical protein
VSSKLGMLIKSQSLTYKTLQHQETELSSQLLYRSRAISKMCFDALECLSVNRRSPPWQKPFLGYDADEDKTMVDEELYRQLIGSLLYLALRTRPDILVAVSILARFSQSPTAYCHRGAKRVVRYLRGTTDIALVYRSGTTEINAFEDSDYAGNTIDRKSVSVYFIKLGNVACIWGSKKQIAVALSTCEAEYQALTMSAKEVVWICRVLSEADFDISSPSLIRLDNQSAIAWATSEKILMNRAKHISVRVHFIRDLVKSGTITIQHVATTLNDADPMTKPVGPTVQTEALKRIGLENNTKE